MSMNQGLRDTQVRPAEQASAAKNAEPKTVQHMSEMRMFALEVGDENGVRRQVMAFRVGGQWYHDPVGEDWLKRLRPIEKNGWLASKLEARFQEAGASVVVPKTDAVDILGE